VKGAETHSSSRSREHGIVVTLRIWTYRFCVIEHDDVDPDEVQHRGVPIL